MNILISACLLGLPCRFDGKEIPSIPASELCRKHTLIPICPEQLGGLSTPRPPAEIRGEQVLTHEGHDVSYAFTQGAQMAGKIAALCGCTHAILKQRSPSCGSSHVYDGSFSGTLRPGNGITAALLRAQGLQVFDETEAAQLMDDHNIPLDDQTSSIRDS